MSQNDSFQFKRERNMPIAKCFGNDGYFLFSSEQSYDKFKQCQSERGLLNAEGVGVPLLHISERSTLVGGSANSPKFLVYKYLLKNASSPPPFSDFEIIAQEGEYTLYKIQICEIYSRSKLTKTEYRLLFDFGPQETSCSTMIESFSSTNIRTYVGDIGLNWNFSFGRDKCKLHLIDPNNEKKRGEENLMGYYTRYERDFLPRAVSKRANLIIKESSNPASYGINDVPVMSQTLACQSLLIHFLEHQRRDPKRREPTRREHKRREASTRGEENLVGYDAQYDRDMQPGIVSNGANRIVKHCSNLASYGINDVPVMGRIFACQRLLTHHLEKRSQ